MNNSPENQSRRKRATLKDVIGQEATEKLAEELAEQEKQASEHRRRLGKRALGL
jgi:hypothetical protein